MSEKQFCALLPIITNAVAEKICLVYHLTEEAAICSLYRSQLYSLLEEEATKVWQYSAAKLFDLYQQEIETGHFELPDC